MPEKLGNQIGTGQPMVSPVGSPPPKPDPGPPVLNSPLFSPGDPLGLKPVKAGKGKKGK